MRHIESRLDKVPTFRRKLLQVPLGLDHPYWVPDNDFDLEFHVRHVALPEAGGLAPALIEVARLHARHLDLSRPPWEMYIIEGLDTTSMAFRRAASRYFRRPITQQSMEWLPRSCRPSFTT